MSRRPTGRRGRTTRTGVARERVEWRRQQGAGARQMMTPAEFEPLL
jgi:hypothetical protein